MQTLAPEVVVERIEQLEALDAVSEPVQTAAQRALANGPRLKEILSGTWLGHPLHPPLTDVVVGSWTSALLLDLAGGKPGRRAADRLVAAGVIAAVPTAASGMSDWSDLHGETRRIGTVHALGNTTALALYACSWLSRRRGHRVRGVGLSTVGYAVATMSAWLGGHLSFVKGVGVNQTAFEEGPETWTPVPVPAELETGDRAVVRVADADVLVVRRGQSLFGLSDRCSHRGCSLAEGEIQDDTVTCRCHGSTFRLADGAVLRGPATAPQRSYEARKDRGELELRRRPTR
jgi:nitrite reductase/ring-hydroxylating ferredoxin subunit/uncharacterized membrane protein